MSGRQRFLVILGLAVCAVCAWGIMWILTISALLVLGVLSFADIGNTLMEMAAW